MSETTKAKAPPTSERPLTAGSDEGPSAPFPLRLSGPIIKGFGRGSKELGIPTANIPLSGLTVGGHEGLESGIYFGWAGLSGAPQPEDSRSSTTADAAQSTSTPQVHAMVMSVGWNPVYNNPTRSVEVHIMSKFPSDFYGAELKLLVLGFVRPEYDYDSLKALVDDINMDIEVTRRSLDRPAYAKFKDEAYLFDFSNVAEVAE